MQERGRAHVLDLVFVESQRFGDPLGEINDRFGMLTRVLVALFKRLREERSITNSSAPGGNRQRAGSA